MIISCQKEFYPLQNIPKQQEEKEELVEMTLDLSNFETKASMLDGCDGIGRYSIKTGCVLLAYESGSGGKLAYAQFFSNEEIAQNSLTLRLPAKKLDFYLIANLNYVNKSNSKVADMLTAYGEQLPLYATTFNGVQGLEDIIYRFNGQNAVGNYRCAYLSEVKNFGIPLSACKKNQNVIANAVLSFDIKRLFSKVIVKADCSSITGGANEVFSLTEVSLRNINCRINPFGDSPTKALSSEDVLNVGDIDEVEITQNSITYTFWTPANCQNIELGENINELKIKDILSDSKKPLCTHLQINAKLDPSLGGYGGNILYRLYLYDKTGNKLFINLQEGRQYNYALSFNANNLFEGAAWNIEYDQTIDTRKFSVMKYASYNEEVGQNGDVIIRPSRNAEVFLYMNKSQQHSGSNALIGKEYNDTEHLKTLTDCTWYINGYSDLNAVNTKLAEYGIALSYDKSKAKLVFSVVNNNVYHNHIGEHTNITFTLKPGNKSYTIRLHFWDNPSIVVLDNTNKNGANTFYVGTRRKVIAKYFYGAVQIRYINDIVDGARPDSRMYRTVNVGNIWDNVVDVDYSFQTFGVNKLAEKSFYLYSYYTPDNSQNIKGTFYVKGTDEFNDGFADNSFVSSEIKLTSPKFLIDLLITGNTLYLDSNECTAKLNYSTVEKNLIDNTESWTVDNGSIIFDENTFTDVFNIKKFFDVAYTSNALSTDIAVVKDNLKQYRIFRYKVYSDEYIKTRAFDFKYTFKYLYPLSINSNPSTNHKVEHSFTLEPLFYHYSIQNPSPSDEYEHIIYVMPNNADFDDFSLIDTSTFGSDYHQKTLPIILDPPLPKVKAGHFLNISSMDNIQFKAIPIESGLDVGLESKSILITKANQNSNFVISAVPQSSNPNMNRTSGVHRIVARIRAKDENGNPCWVEYGNNDSNTLGTFKVYPNLFMGSYGRVIQGDNYSIKFNFSPALMGDTAKVFDNSFKDSSLNVKCTLSSSTSVIYYDSSAFNIQYSWNSDSGFIGELYYVKRNNGNTPLYGSQHTITAYKTSGSGNINNMLMSNFYRQAQSPWYFIENGSSVTKLQVGYYKLHRLQNADVTKNGWVDAYDN